ncbi:MAG: hypothetical protein ACJAZF_001186, partial [Granulosicoccus sp.]
QRQPVEFMRMNNLIRLGHHQMSFTNHLLNM